MREAYLLPCLLILAACGQNTDTSVSETAATTTAATSGATTGDQATSDVTGAITSEVTSEVTSGVTGGMTGTGDATGPSATTTGDPATGDPSLGTTSLTTDEPETTGATSEASASTGEINNCEELEAAFDSETKDIRSCVAADECGQELMGTSCGCTRNWVARLDADTTNFYALIAKAERMGCELFLNGTCDCPAADGFVCEAGICGWNYL